MGFLSIFLGIIGLGVGIPLGLCIGYFLFIYSDHKDEVFKDPVVKPLHELDKTALEDMMSEIPLWVKNPDYDRVDWMNKFVLDMWPYLGKAICSTIRSTAEPIVADFLGQGQYPIQAIEFETLNLGTLPPIIQGLKVFETNGRELVMEPAIKWAGNPNIVIAVKVWSLQIKIQLVDLQVFVAPRITLRPLVPTVPCFASIVVSLMEKPHVDFGLKVLGVDVMAIPGLYRVVQDVIKKEVAKLYLWPQTLEIPVLDALSGAMNKPVGVLHVKVVRGMKLMKMDLLGLSDPYVKLKLSGERLPSKKTTIKKNTLNPEWNETFKLIVKDPQSQILQVKVMDWDKVGSHDRLGMQLVPLKLLTPNEAKEMTLDLLKNTSITVDPNKKQNRGQLVLEMTYAPFKEDSDGFSGPLSPSHKHHDTLAGGESPNGAGVLLVTVIGAEDVEGDHHNNPYAVIIFRGETKKSKRIKGTRDPKWNEDFQFMLEEPPINDRIHIEVKSKRTRISFYSKESLGHVDINLADVVNNGRINEKYHLIDSKNGVLHVELQWNKI